MAEVNRKLTAVPPPTWRYITVSGLPSIDLRVKTPRPSRKRTKGKGSS